MDSTIPGVSEYDSFAGDYDAWSADMTEDVAWYVELAREAGEPVVELAVGTGRVAIPIARETGKRVIGIDRSPAMLAVARERAAGLPVELREGDMRELSLEEPVDLVICPVRSLLHLETWADKRRVFERVAASLRPGGRFAWNAFAFSPLIAAELHGSPPRAGERALGGQPVHPRGQPHRADARRGDETLGVLRAWWVTKSEWEGLVDVAGLEVESLYGGFARRAVRRRVARARLRRAETVSSYDAIARLYDPWSRGRRRGHRLLRRGGARCGRHRSSSSASAPGRIAIPTAAAGVHVIGVDSSAGMLEVCAAEARNAGLADAARPPARRPAQAARRRARLARHLPVSSVFAPFERRGAARGAACGPRRCSAPAGG